MSTRKKYVRKHETEKANMTPMIDVTFLLLIFFILNLSFKKEESALSVFLPPVGYRPNEEPRDVPLDEVRILLRHRETDPIETRTRFSVDGQVCSTLPQIRSRLMKKSRGRQVIIDAQQAVKFGDVVQVLNVAQQLEFNEVNFAGPHWFSKNSKYDYVPVN